MSYLSTGNIHKISFQQSESRSNDLFGLIHMDTLGLYKVIYRGKYKYFLRLVDNSKVAWIHLLKLKSDTFDALSSFVNMRKNQFGKNVKIIRSDNALEFDDNKCGTFFQKLEIVHQTSCTDTPRQNGRAETKHRNIMQMARALRFYAGLPL